MTARVRSFLLGLVALFLLAILAVQYFSDSDPLKRFVIEQVEQQLGRKMDIGSARLSLFPRLRLDLTDVVIRDADPSRTFFKAKTFQLVLRSTPLLRLRVVVKRTNVEQPDIVLRRDGAGHWNYESVAPGGAPPGGQEGSHPLAMLLMIQEATLLDGEVTVIDEMRQDGPRSIGFHVSSARLVKGSKGSLADLSLSATMPAEHGVSSVSLSGQISPASQPPAPAALPAADPATGLPRLQFQGEAALLNVEVRRIAEFFGPRPVPDQIRGSGNLRGKLGIAPGVKGYDLLFSNMRAEAGRLALTGQAGISGILTEQPTFSLSFSSSPITVDELLAKFPMQWVAPRLHEVLDEQEIRGTVEAVTAAFTGALTADVRPSFTGEFKVHDGHAVIGKDRTPINGFSATVLVEADRIRIVEVTGRYGPMNVSGGKAMLSYPEGGLWLEMEIPGEVAAPDLVAWMTTNVEAPALVKTLAELREVQGEAVLTLKLAGAPNSAEGLRFVGGELEGRNLAFRTPKLDDPVEKVTGRLQFSPTGLVFQDVRGRVGSSLAEVNGVLMTDGEPTFEDFVVKLEGEAARLARVLPEGTFKPGEIAGTAEGVLTLAGLAKTPAIKAKVDLKNAAVSVPGLVQKPMGTAASFTLEAALEPRDRLAISRLDLHLPPFRLEGKGSLRLGSKFAVNMALAAQPISLAALPKSETFGGLEAGNLEVSLDIKGRGKNWKAWQYTGWVALTGGVLHPKGLEAPLHDVYLRLQLVRNGADVKRLAFRIKDSDLRLFGTIKNWADPVIEATVESSHLDLALLIPEGERSPMRTVLEDLAAKTHVTLTATANRGTYKHLSLSALSARVGIGNNLVTVDNLDGDAEGGHLLGRLKIRLPQQKPADFDVSAHLTDVPFTKLLRLVGDKSRMVTGNVTTTVVLQGTGRDPKGDLHSLNGKAELIIKHGHIQRGTVVPQILKILNLPALLQGKVDLANEGLPFDKITGTFPIKDGVVRTENLLVDSPILKLTAAGTYDMPADRLDCVVVASPLGSYTKLIQSIPLFGKLFAGERQGFTTAFFEVKGSIKEPDVRYMPLESLRTGVTGMAHLAFDVLKNTILLPKELIAPSDEAQPGAKEPELPAVPKPEPPPARHSPPVPGPSPGPPPASPPPSAPASP